MKRHLWTELLGSVIVVCMSTGCGQKAPALVESKPEEVEVSQPLTREITDHDDFTGRMAAKETVEIRARVRGHLVKVNFQEGEEVKEGDLLFEIDPRPYKASLDQAEANRSASDASLKLANAELARVRLLVSKSAASREELDVLIGKQGVASAEMLRTQAAVEQAKLDLNFTKIHAPISGRISRQFVNVGNLINAGAAETLLTTIVSIDPMYVYFDVDERALLRYQRTGNKQRGSTEKELPLKDLKIPAELALDGEVGFPHRGVIDFADNRVDPTTGTIQVRAVFDNKRRMFAPGLRANIRIPVSDPYRALLVSERAIATDQGKKYLLVVNKDNVVERRDIALGAATDDGLRVVQVGLKPEEWVIVEGMQFVRPRMQVAPTAKPMPTFPTSSAWQPLPAEPQPPAKP